MKIIKSIAFLLVFTTSFTAFSQSADEILNNYFENIGGKEKLEKLQGIKMYAKVNQNGMEIPLEIIQMKDGKQMTLIKFQGKEIRQGVFNGDVLWGDNFMTMKPEKSDKENTENMKLEANDFPSPFLNYKKKNYTVELMGKETIDGAETFKIKLIKEPLTVDGKKVEDVSYYYFDADNFVPIVVESEIKAGPMKGKISQVKMSDYQEVEGIYFPFAMSQGLKDQGGSGIAIEKIELNPKIEAKAFDFPEEEAAAAPDTDKK